ncbi:hypothetical protein JXA88_04000, partial [Candidatus Fermentibacteria bacterium]|nr:hypothetical protein [Candidatus Fermentibacteria bacterium]
ETALTCRPRQVAYEDELSINCLVGGLSMLLIHSSPYGWEWLGDTGAGTVGCRLEKRARQGGVENGREDRRKPRSVSVHE